MQSIQLKVLIEKDLPAVVPEAVSFETGASLKDTQDPALFVYEHHGREFLTTTAGALPRFFEDLVLGRPLPLTFATTAIHDVDTLVALVLFLHRDLAVHPAVPAFVGVVDFVHRGGLPALAHVPEDVARFLCMLRSYFPDKGLTQRELGARLETVFGWLRDYLFNERLPNLGAVPPSVRVLDRGTNGFVVAETPGPLVDGWVDLYRQGYLRGLLVNTGTGDRRQVLAARKSLYVALDLTTAALLLNQMEVAMGELPAWRTDGLWLEGPRDGTLILVSHIMEVLTRV